MSADTTATPLPWSAPSASEVAEAAGASDLFVFRRIADRRFAHVGGIGRGAGWAGIVEVGVDDEPLVQEALSNGGVVRRSSPEPWHVLGPYYAQSVVAVSVSPDVFVVFGSEHERMDDVPDDDFKGLALFAADALVEVTPAKRLADELEALNAVRDLLHAPAETFEEALQRLVDQATAALTCDLGFLYLPEREQLAVCDKRDEGAVDVESATVTLTELAERGPFPVCIQQAEDDDLPAPFSSSDGVLAYYVLEVTRPVSGVLLLLHTRAGVARGFTLLCQALGQRLVEAAEPLLAGALLRDTLNADLERAEREARRDPLTGLANRLAWSEAMESVAPCAERPATIVLLDCRGLKAVNDEYGHGVGDRVLCRIAAAMSAAVRTNDLVARLGGDEFALLLCDADEPMTASIVGRVESAIAADHQHGQPAVSLAIGTATVRDGNLEDAQLRADAEMVAAKRAPADAPRHASN